MVESPETGPEDRAPEDRDSRGAVSPDVRQRLLGFRVDRIMFAVLVLLLAGHLASMIYGAWLSDDFLIGLRQTLNLVHDRGFSFNADQRVQTMTSPLWGLLLAPVVGLFDAFYAPIVFSLVLSFGALTFEALRHFAHPARRTVVLGVVALLLWSKAFIDFSSGGLESPLAYLVGVAFTYALSSLHEAPENSHFQRACACGGLLFLTRFDYALIIAPPLIAAAWRVRSRRVRLRGFAVLAAVTLPWLFFATWYYGSPFPNTFYAKLTTSIPKASSIEFGLRYYQVAAVWDPTSLLLLAFGIVGALTNPRAPLGQALAVGVLLYLGYVVWAGGDFMAGRFLSLPVLLAASLLVETASNWSRRALVAAGLTTTCLLFATSPELAFQNSYLTSKAMQLAGKHPELLPRINDEKNAYLAERGLLTGHSRFAAWLNERVAAWQQPDVSTVKPVVVIDCGGLGWLAFKYGPDHHVLDLCALSDPFISKLPLYRIGGQRELLPWGPGHFTRNEPPGYAASLAYRENQIADPVLARVYDEIRVITTGSLWSLKRLAAIVRLITFDVVFRANQAPSYYGAKLQPLSERLAAPYSTFAALFRTECTDTTRAIQLHGNDRILTWFDGPERERRFELSASPGQYSIRLWHGDLEVGMLDIQVNTVCGHGLGIVGGVLPEVPNGFDRLEIVPATAGAATFGGFRLLSRASTRCEWGDPRLVANVQGCDLPHHGGYETAACTVVTEPNEGRSGHFTFGPYSRLEPGRYEFELQYASSGDEGHASGTWDVVWRTETIERTLARGPLLGSNGSATMARETFWVPPLRPEGAIEVRTSPRGDLSTEIVRLRIAKFVRIGR